MARGYDRTPGGGSGGGASSANFVSTIPPSGDTTGVADTAAIQAAIDAAASAGAGSVLLRAGTYTVRKLTLKTGVILRGQGIDSTFVQLAAGQNSNVIETQNFGTLAGTDNTVTPHNFGWSDLTVDGNSSGQSSIFSSSTASMTSGSAVLTDTSNPFTASMVGMPIRVTAGGPGSKALITTILSYQSAGQVTLAIAASGTVTTGHANWGNGMGIAVYGNAFAARNFRIRNCQSWGLWTEWATQSTWLAPDGMDSKLTEFMIHDCGEGGVMNLGPHDLQSLQFHIVRNGPGAAFGTPQLYVAQNLKSNGSMYDFGHIWGGTTDHCCTVSASGITFGKGMQMEGGRVSQLHWENGGNQFHGRLFSGNVNPTTAVGMTFGQGTAPGAITGRFRVENLGGGVIDWTNAGGNHNVDIEAIYTSTPCPNPPDIGWGATNKSLGQREIVAVTNDGSVLYSTKHPSAVTQVRPQVAASGEYVVPMHSGTGVSSGFTLGTAYLVPVDIGPAQQTFTGIGCQLTIAAVGGTTPKVLVGIYKDDGTGMRPFFGASPLAQGSFDPTAASIGVDTVVTFGTAQTLPPGRYWLALAITSSTAFTTAPTLVNIGTVNWQFTRSDLSNNSWKSWSMTIGASATTLPAIGTLTRIAQAALLGLKAQ